mgnify:CR=1 FL=1
MSSVPTSFPSVLLHVESLFARSIDRAARAESHGATSIAFKIRTNNKRCVHMPMNDVEVVGGENQFMVPGFG